MKINLFHDDNSSEMMKVLHKFKIKYESLQTTIPLVATHNQP